MYTVVVDCGFPAQWLKTCTCQVQSLLVCARQKPKMTSSATISDGNMPLSLIDSWLHGDKSYGHCEHIAHSRFPFWYQGDFSLYIAFISQIVDIFILVVALNSAQAIIYKCMLKNKISQLFIKRSAQEKTRKMTCCFHSSTSMFVNRWYVLMVFKPHQLDMSHHNLIAGFVELSNMDCTVANRRYSSIKHVIFISFHMSWSQLLQTNAKQLAIQWHTMEKYWKSHRNTTKRLCVAPVNPPKSRQLELNFFITCVDCCAKVCILLSALRSTKWSYGLTTSAWLISKTHYKGTSANAYATEQRGKSTCSKTLFPWPKWCLCIY